MNDMTINAEREKLTQIEDAIRAEMWDLANKVTSTPYDNVNQQLRDLQTVGRLATACLDIRNTTGALRAALAK